MSFESVSVIKLQQPQLLMSLNKYHTIQRRSECHHAAELLRLLDNHGLRSDPASPWQAASIPNVPFLLQSTCIWYPALLLPGRKDKAQNMQSLRNVGCPTSAFY